MRYRKWAIAGGIVALLCGIAIYYAAVTISKNFEPYIRQQAISYLRDHFQADLEIASMDIHLPTTSRLKLWATKGKGAIASVVGKDVKLRRVKRPEEPPLLTMRSFSFDVDLSLVFAPVKKIQLVTVDGMVINVPPKGDRSMGSPESQKPESQKEDKHSGGKPPKVEIEQIKLTDAMLVLHPKDPKKKPFEFGIAKLLLESVQADQPMKYKASLENPKPPGHIESTGTFGPWNKDDPGASPLQGKFDFTNADLGVFKAIGGILNSTGSFTGMLSEVHAKGEAVVPQFFLKASGNRLPLRTKYEVMVDGTNGDTVLAPVQAVLGASAFKTSGSIIKHEYEKRRAIDLDVIMPSGRIEDFLKLAMKGADPLMTGVLNLKARIGIPPLAGKVVEKLRLAGTFEIKNGKFLKSSIQTRLDDLSRKGQGQPTNEEIDEVVSKMSGKFTLEDEKITFERLGFSVPGADISLHGDYHLTQETIDFHGSLKLTATVSQTQTGWKRIVLRPVDPFFKKEGAGTFLKIKITGTRTSPSYGLDRGK